MRILFALPGLHRIQRGAEVAFASIANELADRGDDVTVFGSGPEQPGSPYRYLRSPLIPRERFEGFPRMPMFRNETAWEEATFIPGFLRRYRPQDYDVTLTCAYPFLNWTLRTRTTGGRRPAHVFVTQNGDWPARSDSSEFRWFGCEGLVCTNPDFYEANRDHYRAVLIPNGADLERFANGRASAGAFNLPSAKPIVLMVSALIESKMVGIGINAVSRLPDVHLVVAGDGPLRDSLRSAADRLMPGRYHNFTVSADQMPDLYRSANAFLHLSRDESFGNVFVESMASGIPMIAWDLERTRWITGDTALLVPDGDIDALCVAISEGIGGQVPRAELAARAGGFSWTSIAGRYRDFLEEVTNAFARKT